MFQFFTVSKVYFICLFVNCLKLVMNAIFSKLPTLVSLEWFLFKKIIQTVSLFKMLRLNLAYSFIVRSKIV